VIIMAGDNEAMGNGIIVTGVKASFVQKENTAADLLGHVVVEGVWSAMPIDVEPERFRDKGTTLASITFKQLTAEAAETFNIVIEYEIYEAP